MRKRIIPDFLEYMKEGGWIVIALALIYAGIYYFSEDIYNFLNRLNTFLGIY